MRTLTLPNEMGDLTIGWEEDKDEYMEEIIRKKMEQGVRFFIIKPFTKEQVEVFDTSDITTRSINVKDEHIEKFFERVKDTEIIEAVKDTKVSILKRLTSLFDTIKASTDTKEIARSSSIGVRPLRGG